MIDVNQKVTHDNTDNTPCEACGTVPTWNLYIVQVSFVPDKALIDENLKRILQMVMCGTCYGKYKALWNTTLLQ